MFTTKMVATETCINAVANSPINEASRMTPMHRMLFEVKLPIERVRQDALDSFPEERASLEVKNEPATETTPEDLPVDPQGIDFSKYSDILKDPTGTEGTIYGTTEEIDLSEYSDILKDPNANLENSFQGKGSIYDPSRSQAPYSDGMAIDELPDTMLDQGWYDAAWEEYGITKKFINHVANPDEAPEYFTEYLLLDGKMKIFNEINLLIDADVPGEERENTLTALKNLFGYDGENLSEWHLHLKSSLTGLNLVEETIPPSWAVHIAAEEGLISIDYSYLALTIPIVAVLFFVIFAIASLEKCTGWGRVPTAFAIGGGVVTIPGFIMLMQEGIQWSAQEQAINMGIIDETFGFAAMEGGPEFIVGVGAGILLIASIFMCVLKKQEKLYK